MSETRSSTEPPTVRRTESVIRLPRSAATLHFVRRNVELFLDSAIIRDADWRWRVVTVAHELTANAVDHAEPARPDPRTPLPDDRLQVLLRAERPRTVAVTVIDRAPHLLPRPCPPDVAAERGRGLLLVAALADRWACEVDGTEKWVRAWCSPGAAGG